VLAGARSPERAADLQALRDANPDHVTILPLEVTDEGSIAASLQIAREALDGIDVLFNNAAISPGDIWHDREDGRCVLDEERALDHFRVNTIAPLQIALAALPLLKAGTRPRVVNLSSGAGSLTYKTDGGLYSYSASKAALNMFSRAMAWDLKDDGIIVVMLDPGWVRTDMGGPEAWITADESVGGIIPLVDRLDMDDTGEFFHYQGGKVAW
jgi:NAD(P)-dependent dehydrogenase (short-subunit alcohol dehydrogenase family)